MRAHTLNLGRSLPGRYPKAHNTLKYNMDKVTLVPRGSIAFKLGLLATDACDFIVTKRPKNIWDIAAGTHLSKIRGINCYEISKKEFNLFSGMQFGGPLIWCRPEHLDTIISSCFAL